ncbi:E3 ubiquitin-protein ligase MIB2-like isoform X1 [Liolophura sinensis]|uniref:E3 ubiquitin-protein ligase MIB2-like isoform X1 n=1 Tax=Liolophura sinensis TaxID=3198878 RepID=UPI0031585F13
MSVGCRVVRGPDWTYGNQDGGEGHLGTVVEIGKPGSTNLPEKTAAVIWDSGGRGTYRAGQNGAYDLRIFDNATTGVNHPNIVCGSCGQPVIHGMRWHCTVCTDSHLCTVCYMADKHDLTHPFRRFDTASSEGEAVPKREGCTEIQAKGIFPGAKVVKGPDWEWEDQDCGIGNIGQVTSVGCWARGLTSVRSAVKVKWSSGSTYGYRVGHEGKVDLVYIEEESGGSYYKDHLPVLGGQISECSKQLRFLYCHTVRPTLIVWGSGSSANLKIQDNSYSRGFPPGSARFPPTILLVKTPTKKINIKKFLYRMLTSELTSSDNGGEKNFKIKRSTTNILLWLVISVKVK